jgi:AAA domain (dynein-related subfamily)
MAVAASLIPGFQYKVESGIYEGEIVTIVDNETFPDNHEHRRKITVQLQSGDIEYLLPRLLGSQPIGIANAAISTPTIVAETPVADEPVVSHPQPVTPAQVSTLRVLTVADPIVDPMDPRLDQFRPSPKKCRRYIRRTLDNGMTDVEYFLTHTTDPFRAKNEGRPANMMMKGDTQTGKTFLVEVLAVEWANQLGLPKPMPIFTLSGSSGVTDYDLFGQPTAYTGEDGVERLVWLPGIVDIAARVGGILYLDEVNAMGERVTSSLFPLVDHRHMFINRNKAVVKGGEYMPETVVASMDLWVISTFNEGYRGMGELNEAWNARSRTVIWDYDPDVEAKLVKSPTIRLLAEALRTARKANKIRTPVGTASLERLEQDVAAFGPGVALWTFEGMFKHNERDIVHTIIEDRSIEVLLLEEQRQNALNVAAEGSDE